MTKKTAIESDATFAAAVAGSMVNDCFGCGPDNPEGMKLKFVHDEQRERFVARFELSKRYTGPPGHAHGGIIATILDEAMGKSNRLCKVVAVTKELTVEYLKLVPLGKPLVAEGWNHSIKGRVLIHMAEIRSAEGEVLARSRGTFITVDPHKMFADHINRDGRGGPDTTDKQLER